VSRRSGSWRRRAAAAVACGAALAVAVAVAMGPGVGAGPVAEAPATAPQPPAAAPPDAAWSERKPPPPAVSAQVLAHAASLRPLDRGAWCAAAPAGTRCSAGDEIEAVEVRWDDAVPSP
jgi:hypothetical protein